MKKYFFFLSFCLLHLFYSQSTIKVIDGDTKSPISNASIKCLNRNLGVTNNAGIFSTKEKCSSISVVHPKYYLETAVLEQNITVILSKKEDKLESIEGIIIKDESDPRALAILNKVNDNYAQNSPRSLDSYSYKSYEKISMDIDEDSINSYNQTLKETVKGMDKMPLSKIEKKADSTSTIKEVFATSKLFLWERAQEFLYSKKYGEKIIVLDNRVSGLTDPFYEMMAIQNNRNKIPKEARLESRRLYRYFLTDSLNVDGRSTYKISFREVTNKKNENKNKFSGYMYVDKETYGIKKIANFRKIASEGSISSVWNLIDGKWFLDNESVRIKLSNVILQDSKDKKDEDKNEKKEKRSNVKKENYNTYGFVTSKYFEVKTDISQNPKDFKGYTFTVENSDGSLLEKYRTEPLTDREKNTYKVIDSLGKKLGAQRKANVFSSLLHGKIRYGMVNFDAASILGYNQYEGIRLGVNAKLNEKFNRYISPDAYIAYGFKDEGFKYGVGLDVKTTLDKVSFFRLEYYNDVDAAGRFNENFWNFNMKISNSGVSLNNDKFYHFRGGKFSFERDLSNSLSAKIAASYQNESSRFLYNYNSQGNEFENFSTKLSMMYAPFSKNIMTPAGKYTTEKKFPDLFVNVEQSFESFGGDFSFTKVDVLFNHQFTTKWGKTGLRVYGGKVFGDAPIWHNFTMNGLGGNSNLNFNLASYLGFATMKGGKYFNDEFAGQYFSHGIPWYFRTFGKDTSSFNLLYRSIIGNMKNTQDHQFEFEKLDHLYQEVGLEWDNFLSSRFNLGFFYRVGHYHTDKFSDNFAIQLKLKLLGF